MFYKLAMRAFPNYFKPDSIYAHYPMTIPSENRNIMKNLGRESHYSYDRPRYTEPVPNLLSYSNAQLVLNSQKDFTVPWGGLSSIHAGKGGADFWSKSFDNEQWRNSVKEFYEDATLKLLNEKSCKLAGNKQVDIARE